MTDKYVFIYTYVYIFVYICVAFYLCDACAKDSGENVEFLMQI